MLPRGNNREESLINKRLGIIKANKIVLLTDEGLSDARSVLSQATIPNILSEPTGLLAAATCTTVFLSCGS